MSLCPCGSGRPFPECCRPFLTGAAQPPTAEALMRSRYTAYVRRDEAYLLRTWHPRTRPATLDVEGGTWRGLEILATQGGQAADASGTVVFAAHYADEVSRNATMRETSRFERVDDAWVYVEGDVD